MSASAYILIVDDDDDIRETIIMVLDLEGYRAVGVGDGLEALDWLRSQPQPSLILLDLMMPRLNGVDFIQRQRCDPTLAEIPVVVMSGGCGARELALALGARDCLEKPMEEGALLGAIERHAPLARTGLAGNGMRG
jgi:CheY-like chemotaxis protein